MTASPAPEGRISRLPVHHGDGYSWGGDIIVTFGGRSINLGADADELARLLAAAPALFAAVEPVKAILDGTAPPLPPNAVWVSVPVAWLEGLRALLPEALR